MCFLCFLITSYNKKRQKRKVAKEKFNEILNRKERESE